MREMYEKVLRTDPQFVRRSRRWRVDIQDSNLDVAARRCRRREHRCGEPVGVYWLR